MTSAAADRPRDKRQRPAKTKVDDPPYTLLAIAIVSLLAAAFGIADGLRRLGSANHDVATGFRTIAAAEALLSIAREAESGQRGYVLTGDERFLAPYYSAAASAPDAWTELEKLATADRNVGIDRMHRSFLQKAAYNQRAITLARQRGLLEARRIVQDGTGKALMDQLNSDVRAFVGRERARLRLRQAESNAAYRNALLQAVMASFALVLAGALLCAAIRKAQSDAAQNAERALQADRRFEAMFEQSAVGMILLTKSGNAIIVNDAMTRMTGYSRAHILTAPRHAPAHPLSLLIDKASGQGLPIGGHQHAQWEHWTRTKNGEPLCLSVTLSAVRAPDGAIAFFSGLARDITAQRQTEMDLQNSLERSRRLQGELAHIGRVNALGEMAAAIAHEINQPLTAITNYVAAGQRLMTDLPDANRRIAQALQGATEQAKRASEIIKRMHSFVTHREDARSTEALAQLINSAIDLAMLGIDKARISITHEHAPFHYMVHVDVIQIQQILLILIRNAIDAARDQAALHIAIRKRWDPVKNRVAIIISDNGPGLTREITARLFQPFVTSKPGHMGMGLSIAKRLVDLHGGRLCHTPNHPGATFQFDLPVLELRPPPSNCPALLLPAKDPLH